MAKVTYKVEKRPGGFRVTPLFDGVAKIGSVTQKSEKGAKEAAKEMVAEHLGDT